MKKEKWGIAWPDWLSAGITLLLGVALLIKPGMAMRMVLNLTGIALIIAGLAAIARDWQYSRDPSAFNWQLSIGLIVVAIGVLIILGKGFLLRIVPILFGIGLLFCGIVKVQAAVNLYRVGYPHWMGMALTAVISIALGVVLMCRPFRATMNMVRLIGLSLVVEAVQDLFGMRTYRGAIITKFKD